MRVTDIKQGRLYVGKDGKYRQTGHISGDPPMRDRAVGYCDPTTPAIWRWCRLRTFARWAIKEVQDESC